MLFEDLFNYEKLNDTNSFTLYRGTDNEDPYSESVIFFSTSKEFAADYGKNIYKAEIQPTKIFDSFNKKHWELLFQWCGKDGVRDTYNDKTYYSFKEMSEDNNDSDTWEIIEECLWAFPSEYDVILITEGGEVNFIVLDKDIIIKSELLN